MLKTGIVFILACIIWHSANAQVDNQKHELYKKLKISSIQVELSSSRQGAKLSEPKTFAKYGLNENGFISAYNTIETKGKFVFLTYNDKHQIIEEKEYINNKIVPVKQYTYNEIGQLEFIMQLNPGNNKFWMSDTLVYYTSGTLKTKSSFRFMPKTPVLAKTDSFSVDGDKSWEKDLQKKTLTITSYDEDGQPVMISTYRNGGKIPELTRQFEYNDKGKLIKESLFVQNNSVPAESKKYTYNVYGDVLKIEITGESSGDGNYALEYKYEYDENGLMIKKTENNKAFGIINQFTFKYMHFEETQGQKE
jgi:hypothetical protein